MKKFYTTVGIFKLKNKEQNNMYPVVILGGNECKLDVQEMLIWTALNWRVLNQERLYTYYESQEKKTDAIYSRSFNITPKQIAEMLLKYGFKDCSDKPLTM